LGLNEGAGSGLKRKKTGKTTTEPERGSVGIYVLK
jgi:hypothetical protein